jgi:hypothetical protein
MFLHWCVLVLSGNRFITSYSPNHDESLVKVIKYFWDITQSLLLKREIAILKSQNKAVKFSEI